MWLKSNGTTGTYRAAIKDRSSSRILLGYPPTRETNGRAPSIHVHSVHREITLLGLRRCRLPMYKSAVMSILRIHSDACLQPLFMTTLLDPRLSGNGIRNAVLCHHNITCKHHAPSACVSLKAKVRTTHLGTTDRTPPRYPSPSPSFAAISSGSRSRHSLLRHLGNPRSFAQRYPLYIDHRLGAASCSLGPRSRASS